MGRGDSQGRGCRGPLMDTTDQTITVLVEGFYFDCQRDHREPIEENLRAWLWFTCPAQFRSQAGPAIRADARFHRGEGRPRNGVSSMRSYHVRFEPEDWERVTQAATKTGETNSQFVRRATLKQLATEHGLSISEWLRRKGTEER